MKKEVNGGNYLERTPKPAETIAWEQKDGIVTIVVENRGVFHKLAQKLLKKPKKSYIHLDAFGSFAFLQMDGTRTILDIGKLVEAQFGEEAHPLYERLAKFCQILDSYGFIQFTK